MQKASHGRQRGEADTRTWYVLCSALIVSPPLPMTRPTMPLGHSTTREMPAPNCTFARTSSARALSGHKCAGDSEFGNEVQHAHYAQPAKRHGVRAQPSRNGRLPSSLYVW